jgi:lipopolysaccharide export system protein LptA
VDVQSGDGSLRAGQAVVYLQPAPTGKDAEANNGKKATLVSTSDGSGFMGGKLEKMVATGNIVMEQPGRRATGEQVVYTASDSTYVLTGTAMVLPKVMDDQRGTVTGASLRFHSDDDSVVVSNGGDSGAGQRVRTETRVKNKQ